MKVGSSEVVMVMQSPHQRVVTLISSIISIMLTTTTGVTICDCLNLSVTLQSYLKIIRTL